MDKLLPIQAKVWSGEYKDASGDGEFEEGACLRNRFNNGKVGENK
jgi:hypothetical protein